MVDSIGRNNNCEMFLEFLLHAFILDMITWLKQERKQEKT